MNEISQKIIGALLQHGEISLKALSEVIGKDSKTGYKETSRAVNKLFDGGDVNKRKDGRTVLVSITQEAMHPEMQFVDKEVSDIRPYGQFTWKEGDGDCKGHHRRMPAGWRCVWSYPWLTSKGLLDANSMGYRFDLMSKSEVVAEISDYAARSDHKALLMFALAGGEGLSILNPDQIDLVRAENIIQAARSRSASKPHIAPWDPPDGSRIHMKLWRPGWGEPFPLKHAYGGMPIKLKPMPADPLTYEEGYRRGGVK